MNADATTRSHRARDAARTRDDLVRAARRRFTVLGYERTTMRAVAADANVNVSLINRYFGSKDGLFAAVLDDSKSLFEDSGEDSADNTADNSADNTADNAADNAAGVHAALAEGLRARDWAEYGGEHPIMLMLRDAGSDPVSERLRRESLLAGVERLRKGLRGTPPKVSEDASRLRAELILALYIGVVTLRHLLPGECVATADEKLLDEELWQIVRSISRCDD